LAGVPVLAYTPGIDSTYGFQPSPPNYTPEEIEQILIDNGHCDVARRTITQSEIDELMEILAEFRLTDMYNDPALYSEARQRNMELYEYNVANGINPEFYIELIRIINEINNGTFFSETDSEYEEVICNHTYVRVPGSGFWSWELHSGFPFCSAWHFKERYNCTKCPYWEIQTTFTEYRAHRWIQVLVGNNYIEICANCSTTK
jgi:hypothetical protein